MIVAIEDKTIMEEFREKLGRNPTNDEKSALKNWFESDVYEWIKDNINSFLSSRGK
jgi:hypothetical protein